MGDEAYSGVTDGPQMGHRRPNLKAGESPRPGNGGRRGRRSLDTLVVIRPGFGWEAVHGVIRGTSPDGGRELDLAVEGVE